MVDSILSSGPPTHIVDLIPLLEPSFSLALPHRHLASNVFLRPSLGTRGGGPSNVSSAPRIPHPSPRHHQPAEVKITC